MREFDDELDRSTDEDKRSRLRGEIAALTSELRHMDQLEGNAPIWRCPSCEQIERERDPWDARPAIVLLNGGEA